MSTYFIVKNIKLARHGVSENSFGLTRAKRILYHHVPFRRWSDSKYFKIFVYNV